MIDDSSPVLVAVMPAWAGSNIVMNTSGMMLVDVIREHAEYFVVWYRNDIKAKTPTLEAGVAALKLLTGKTPEWWTS